MLIGYSCILSHSSSSVVFVSRALVCAHLLDLQLTDDVFAQAET